MSMEIWIIKGGRRYGPYRDYEIREQIRSGKIRVGTYGWHSQLSEWQLLEEMECFRSDFEMVREQAIEAAAKPPPLPRSVVVGMPWRRFWARWLDLSIYSAIFWLGIWGIGGDVREIMLNGWAKLLLYVPWFAVESWMIHRYATTPGKWLLQLRVLNQDGSHLSLNQAVIRSLRVLCLGIAFGWELMTVLCQMVGYVSVKTLHRSSWDLKGEHQVIGQSIRNPFRLAVYAVLMVVALQLESAVLSRYRIEQMVKQKPELREIFERYPTWQLPENK